MTQIMKKKNKVRMPAKSHDIPKKEEGGVIAESLKDVGKFKKQAPTNEIFKKISNEVNQ